MSDIHFRMKSINTRSEEDIHYKLKSITMALMLGGISHSKTELIAKEGSLSSNMQITAHSQIYESSNGYKYKLGYGNDWRIDNLMSSENIFLINYRYGNEEKMQKIGKGLCALLDLDYIYNIEFEIKVMEIIHPIISIKQNYNSGKDQIFEESRLLIESTMKKLNLNENDLKDKSTIDQLIEYMTMELLNEFNLP